MDGIRLGGHRLRRVIFGRRILAWSIKHGIPAGITVDPKLNPPEDCNLDSSVRELELAMDRYSKYRGRLKAHPIFGRLDREHWDQLHCLHCAHHLSHIVPERSRENLED